jgi:hypothetical protein
MPGGMRLFIFGFGYSGRAVAKRLRPRLAAFWGTSRAPDTAREGHTGCSAPLLFEAVSPMQPAMAAADEERLSEALRGADHVLVTIPPGEAGDPVLKKYRGQLSALKPRALVYLSTVGVYGDHGGAWVDETTPCKPVSRRSALRLEAEAAWRLFAEETGVPVAIVRLGGIYGPGRGPFEKIRAGTARRIMKPGQVFNRIHVDDIAAIVEAAFDRRADGIFNGVDDEPAAPDVVLAYAAELLGLPAPPEADFEATELTPMARSFYGESKRVRNDLIKRRLGVKLAYPTYREGLRAILAAESRGEAAV